MTMAELETAVREERARRRDRLRQRALRDDPDAPGPAGQPDVGPATDLGPIDFAAIARACGARGVRVETRRRRSSRPCGRRSPPTGPTVIQLALDRRWVSVDQPATA